jgi:hypothetical protein
MPSPETPGSSTSSVPGSDVDIGLCHDLKSSALPMSLQSVSRRVFHFRASTVHAFATACQFACPPCTDPTSFPAVGGFYYQASNGSVALPVAGYNYNSDWTYMRRRLSSGYCGGVSRLAILITLGWVNCQFPRSLWGHSLGPFFGSTRAASILPSRPPNLAAGARRACQGWPRLRGHPKGSALIGPSTAAR